MGCGFGWIYDFGCGIHCGTFLFWVMGVKLQIKELHGSWKRRREEKGVKEKNIKFFKKII